MFTFHMFIFIKSTIVEEASTMCILALKDVQILKFEEMGKQARFNEADWKKGLK